MLIGSNQNSLGIAGSNHQYASAQNVGHPIATVDRISAAFDASAALVDRVSRLADRIAGSVPALAGGSTVKPVSQLGVIPELVDRAETTISGIGDANFALARLEALFGL